MTDDIKEIKSAGIPSSISVGEPTVSLTIREAIENHLFNIAKEHALLASHDVDRNDVSKMQTEMKHSIIAIVMSFTALEALSNDLYQRLTKNDFDSDDYVNKFKNRDPTSRWNYLTKLAYQKKNNTNEIRSLPSKITLDLDDLTELRHQIIHYKPISENIDTLRRTPDNHVVSPELAIFTSEEVTKATETVRNVLKTFEEITGYEVPKLE